MKIALVILLAPSLPHDIPYPKCDEANERELTLSDSEMTCACSEVKKNVVYGEERAQLANEFRTASDVRTVTGECEGRVVKTAREFGLGVNVERAGYVP